MGFLVALAFHGGCLCASGRHFRSSRAIASDFHLRLLRRSGIPWSDSFWAYGSPLDTRTQNHTAPHSVVRRWDTLCILEKRKLSDIYQCMAKNAFHIFSLDPNIVDDEKDSWTVVGYHPERISCDEFFDHPIFQGHLGWGWRTDARFQSGDPWLELSGNCCCRHAALHRCDPYTYAVSS